MSNAFPYYGGVRRTVSLMKGPMSLLSASLLLVQNIVEDRPRRSLSLKPQLTPPDDVLITERKAIISSGLTTLGTRSARNLRQQLPKSGVLSFAAAT